MLAKFHENRLTEKSAKITHFRLLWILPYSRVWRPSQHDTLYQCWVNVEQASVTLAQHSTSIGLMCRVCWDTLFLLTGVQTFMVHGFDPVMQAIFNDQITRRCLYFTYIFSSVQFCYPVVKCLSGLHNVVDDGDDIGTCKYIHSLVDGVCQFVKHTLPSEFQLGTCCKNRRVFCWPIKCQVRECHDPQRQLIMTQSCTNWFKTFVNLANCNGHVYFACSYFEDK